MTAKGSEGAVKDGPAPAPAAQRRPAAASHPGRPAPAAVPQAKALVFGRTAAVAQGKAVSLCLTCRCSRCGRALLWYLRNTREMHCLRWEASDNTTQRQCFVMWRSYVLHGEELVQPKPLRSEDLHCTDARGPFLMSLASIDRMLG